jgi:hypothetical protein
LPAAASGNTQAFPSEEADVYIGAGTLVVIAVIVLLIWLL